MGREISHSSSFNDAASTLRAKPSLMLLAMSRGNALGNVQRSYSVLVLTYIAVRKLDVNHIKCLIIKCLRRTLQQYNNSNRKVNTTLQHGKTKNEKFSPAAIIEIAIDIAERQSPVSRTDKSKIITFINLAI